MPQYEKRPPVYIESTGNGRDSYIHLNNGGLTVYGLPETKSKASSKPRNPKKDSTLISAHAKRNKGKTAVGLCRKVNEKPIRVFGEASLLRTASYASIHKEQKREQSQAMKRLAKPKFRRAEVRHQQQPETMFNRPSTAPLKHSASAPTLGKLGPKSGRPALQNSFNTTFKKPPRKTPGHTTALRALQPTFTAGTFRIPSYKKSDYNGHLLNTKQNLRNHRGVTMSSQPNFGVTLQNRADFTFNHPLFPTAKMPKISGTQRNATTGFN